MKKFVKVCWHFSWAAQIFLQFNEFCAKKISNSNFAKSKHSLKFFWHFFLGLFDGIHECCIFRDQCMRIRSFLGSDYRDCHVNLPHIIRWTCPRLRSSCGCHLFLYEDGNKTRKNAENIRVSTKRKKKRFLLRKNTFKSNPKIFNS